MELDGYWLDAHSGAIPEPVLDLTARIVPRLPNLRAIIFEILPSFLPRLGLEGVAVQLEQLGEIWERRPQSTSRRRCGHAHLQPILAQNCLANPLTPTTWEDTLGALVVGNPYQGKLATELTTDPGMRIFQRLVWDFRAGIIVSTLKRTTRLLLLHGGEELLRDLLTGFFRTFPPHLFASAEAESFAEYLDSQHLDLKYLAEILSFERAVIQTLITDETHTVRFPYDPQPVLQALAEGYVPSGVTEGTYEIDITPDVIPNIGL